MAQRPLRIRDFLVPLLAPLIPFVVATLILGYLLFILNVYIAVKVLREFGLL